MWVGVADFAAAAARLFSVGDAGDTVVAVVNVVVVATVVGITVSLVRKRSLR